MEDRSIIHLNVTDFAVAVERLQDTSLQRHPVIVAPQQAARALVYDMTQVSGLTDVQQKNKSTV